MQKYLLSISVVWVLLALIIGVILMIQPVLKAVKNKPASTNSVSYTYNQYAVLADKNVKTEEPVKAVVFVGEPGEVQTQVRIK